MLKRCDNLISEKFLGVSGSPFEIQILRTVMVLVSADGCLSTERLMAVLAGVGSSLHVDGGYVLLDTTYTGECFVADHTHRHLGCGYL